MTDSKITSYCVGAGDYSTAANNKPALASNKKNWRD